MTTYEPQVRHLIDSGYFSLPAQTTDFDHMMQKYDGLWQQFCDQTLELKQRHVFGGFQGNGYEYKGPDNTDYKENFHLSPGYEMPVLTTEIDKAFVAQGKVVLNEVVPTVRAVMETLSEASHVDMVDLVMNSQNDWVLRSLYYPPDLTGRPRAYLAAPHIDKGITIHLSETCGGLRVLWKGKWMDVPSAEGHVHGYAGMLGQYYSKCGLKALCHDVVPTEFSRKYGRRSHVLFCDFGGVRYNKGTFGPTQKNFPNGENYAMGFDEFKKFFVQKELVLGS